MTLPKPMKTVPYHIEVHLTPPLSNPCIPQTAQLSLLQTTIEAILQTAPARTGKLALPPTLSSLTIPTSTSPLKISSIHTTLSDDDPQKTLPPWKTRPVMHLYTHSPSAPAPPVGACITALPNGDLHRWESLHFGNRIKSVILSYIVTRQRLSFLPCSGFILLHGPPGSGKSAVAEAVANKVAIRCGQGVLVRLTHGVMSKYFGESAARIGGVFQWILQRDGIVVVVIDEIESFGMVRNDRGNGDGIRVTNALLTGLDMIRSFRNVCVIGTSNCLDNVDGAVRDRADVCLRIEEMGNGGREALLKELLEGCVEMGVLDKVGALDELVKVGKGISGRRLQGCVVVALGMVEEGCVDWVVFENSLRKTLLMARGELVLD